MRRSAFSILKHAYDYIWWHPDGLAPEDFHMTLNLLWQKSWEASWEAEVNLGDHRNGQHAPRSVAAWQDICDLELEFPSEVYEERQADVEAAVTANAEMDAFSILKNAYDHIWWHPDCPCKRDFLMTLDLLWQKAREV